MICNKDSIVFKSINIGHLTLRNRFMRSATYEGLADIFGSPTQKLLDQNVKLSDNLIGLIIPGGFSISKRGQCFPRQCRMFTASNMKNWQKHVKIMHDKEAKVVFQLMHGGSKAIPFERDEPLPTASKINDRTRELKIYEIEEIVEQFRNSANLAYLCGADGVQLNCAHGYLISEFLSPYTNRRTDKYGGSIENRMRILNDIIDEIKNSLPTNFSLSLKINGDDCIEGGLTPKDTSEIISKLRADIDFYELTCGLKRRTFAVRSRPNKDILSLAVEKEKLDECYNNALKKSEGIEYKEEYNLEALKVIKKNNPNVRLALCGGVRQFSRMESLVKSKLVDIISLSRPFIRDPGLIRRFQMGTVDSSTCVNCGSCMFHVDPEEGVQCHLNKL